MKAHIVFAHPNVDSFNGELKKVIDNALQLHGWQITHTNLYQVNFKAIANESDFTELSEPGYFDLQTEQLHAATHHTFVKDILQEQALLDDADAVIFQFPLWWESIPALLKGYIDRVFSYGWAYGPQYALMGKTAFVSLTTGAPEVTWKPGARGTIDSTLKPFLKGTLEFCGMRVLPTFVAYGAKTKTDKEKEQVFQNLRAVIEEHLKELP